MIKTDLIQDTDVNDKLQSSMQFQSLIIQQTSLLLITESHWCFRATY